METGGTYNCKVKYENASEMGERGNDTVGRDLRPDKIHNKIIGIGLQNLQLSLCLTEFMLQLTVVFVFGIWLFLLSFADKFCFQLDWMGSFDCWTIQEQLILAPN